MPDEKEGGDAKLEAIQKELAETKAALKAANAENAERRLRLKAIEEKEAEKLTETEKMVKRIQELEAKDARAEAEKRQRQIDDAIEAKAGELGFANPKDARALIDTSKVEITEAGLVKGFEAELDALLKSNRLPLKGESTRKPGTLILDRMKQAGSGGNNDNLPPVLPSLTHL